MASKAWMLRALTCLFDPKCSPSDNFDGQPIIPPAQWSISDEDEERLLSRPEVQRYVEAVSASISDALGGLGPAPRKIRLSSGFPGWSPSASPVRNPCIANNKTRQHFQQQQPPVHLPQQHQQQEIVQQLRPLFNNTSNSIASNHSVAEDEQEPLDESFTDLHQMLDDPLPSSQHSSAVNHALSLRESLRQSMLQISRISDRSSSPYNMTRKN